MEAFFLYPYFGPSVLLIVLVLGRITIYVFSENIFIRISP